MTTTNSVLEPVHKENSTKVNTWTLDPVHSEVHFKVKHLMITNVTGQFKVIQATLETKGEAFDNTKVSFSAEAASISTNNEQRDAHLKGADFFDAEKFPTITFTASTYNAGSGKVNGELTIKSVTKPVELDVEFGGVTKDPWGNEKSGFSLTGKINRQEWGLSWNGALEAGGVLLGDEIKINAEVQFTKSK